MNRVRVRTAEPRDHAWLAELPEFPHTDVTNDQALTLGVHLVVEVDGVRVGALTASDNGHWLELTHVYVASNARRAGAGRALLHALQNAAIGRTRSRILLEVRADNFGAIALYQGEGFAQFHVRKDYYSDGQDALELEWEYTRNVK